MDATMGLPLLIGLIAIALLFDFLNGLHDAANSIATIVSTRVMRPHYAVVWAAFFNFIAFLFFGAQTIGTRIIAAAVVDPRVIFGALLGAIAWNLITWRLGIPSSSSHALIGGLLGAGVAKAGAGAIVWTGVAKTGAAIVLSPLLGFVLALLLVLAVSWTFVRGRRSPSTAPSARSSSSPPRCTRSGTAATMPRRRWASSPACSTRRGCSGRSSMCRSGW
jgi:inorganic phosphate transporter, PiT family